MDDGSVEYKLMGALAEKKNLGKTASIIGELKRRIELIFDSW